MIFFLLQAKLKVMIRIQLHFELQCPIQHLGRLELAGPKEVARSYH